MAAADLYARIQERLQELKLSPRAASLASGKGADVIRNLQRAVEGGKEYDFRSGTLEALAYVLETTPDWLMNGHGPEAPAQIRHLSPPDTGDMPIFATVSIDDDQFDISDYQVARIPRPFLLQNAPDAYGILIETNSMSPAYELGDVVLVHPKLGGRNNQDVLVRQAALQERSQPAIIRRLTMGQGLNRNPKLIRLSPHVVEPIPEASTLILIVARLNGWM